MNAIRTLSIQASLVVSTPHDDEELEQIVQEEIIKAVEAIRAHAGKLLEKRATLGIYAANAPEINSSINFK